MEQDKHIVSNVKVYKFKKWITCFLKIFEFKNSLNMYQSVLKWDLSYFRIIRNILEISREILFQFY